ncbi:MAG TPA: hypothetical protein VN767_26800 [Streptosporangiaceae bacterium]|jgi:predicted DNA-binding protein (MmcQ/YjbR family)|nr:hypothetical protein [Streptosporangiaceae bacterium]
MTRAELMSYCLDKPGAWQDEEVFEAIDSSYEAVVAKLPKKDRQA